MWKTKQNDFRALGGLSLPTTANKLGTGIAEFPKRAVQWRERRELQFPTRAATTYTAEKVSNRVWWE